MATLAGERIDYVEIKNFNFFPMDAVAEIEGEEGYDIVLNLFYVQKPSLIDKSKKTN